MKKLAALLLFFAASVTPAFAAHEGPYIAVDLGSASLSGADFGGPFGNLLFPNPGTFQLSGGMRVSPNLAVEGGLVFVGDSTIISSAGSETLQTSALYIAGVGILPLSEQAELYGKLGFSSVSVNYNSNFVAPATGSQANLMWGLGAQFNMSRAFGIHVQYQNFGTVDFPFGTFNLPQATSIGLSTFTVGAVFSF